MIAQLKNGEEICPSAEPNAEDSNSTEIPTVSEVFTHLQQNAFNRRYRLYRNSIHVIKQEENISMLHIIFIAKSRMFVFL